MNRHLVTAALFGLLLVGPLPAEDKPQDVVFLAPSRPMVLRLHVEVDGQPYDKMLEKWVKELFQFLDRDKNGVLDEVEAERAPKAPALAQRLRQGANTYTQYQTTPLAEVDDNDDDKVTLAELTKYYRGSDLALPRLVATPATGYSSDALTEALFGLFDTNKDGKLTPDEMTRAADILAKYDGDDDETLSAQEVFPNGGMSMGPRPAAETGMMAMSGSGAGPRSFFIPQGRLDLGLQMVARYDIDRDGKLTPEEAGLEAPLFKRLDGNGDGHLGGPELLTIVGSTPDLELILRIGGPADKPAAEVVSPNKDGATFHTKASAGGLTMTVGTAQLDLRTYGAPGPVDANQQLSQFAATLAPADTTNKGYVTRSDVSKPQGRALQPIFDVGDLNGDGKLKAEELLALFQMDMKAASCVLTLSAGEMGRGLFEVMDMNRDGRLSLREMRTACERVAGDAGIDMKALPSQFSIAVNLGSATFGRAAGPAAPTAALRPTGAGPLWFRKMDGNGDGDVSRREWLGSLADFKRFDLDGDGMINPDEAAKAK